MTTVSAGTRPLTAELARYAAQSRYADMPEHVRLEAARAFMNWMGCALGGCREDAVKLAAQVVAEQGGQPQASVIGHALRTDIANAAFVNCISSAVLGFDDAHLATVTHPSSPAGSAVFAFSERQTVAGGDFLNAFALAMEYECRLSNALLLPPAKFNVGFYVTGLSGPIGVAAAIGNLLRLDEQRMNWALGIAASTSSGFRATHGTMTAHFRPGHITRSGIWAALLAEKGFTSDTHALEADAGFADVFSSNANLDRAVDGLGSEFELLTNAYKPYPCGIVIHPTLDACLEIREQSSPGSKPVDVKLIVNPLTIKLTGIRTPNNALDAIVSVYHCAAAALVRGAAGVAEMQQDCIENPEVVALRNRIEAVADSSLGPGQASAEVTFSDGRTFRSQVQAARGSASRPMSDDELDAKFRAQASLVLPSAKVENLLRLCRDVASLPDVGKTIGAALQPSTP